VIAVDTNILVYAHRPEAPFHDAARRCVAGLAEGRGAWAIPFHCLIEFTAIVTQPRIWQTPSTLAGAFDQVHAWRESPRLRVIGDSDSGWPTFETLARQARVGGGALHDARIAACCLHHGVSELWTADRDFGRYPTLQCRNPLIG
jgi:toxin-antitoxin system PIN domain toxin